MDHCRDAHDDCTDYDRRPPPKSIRDVGREGVRSEAADVLNSAEKTKLKRLKEKDKWSTRYAALNESDDAPFHRWDS